MKRLFLLVIICMGIVSGGFAQITLDYCLKRADENYPLIKRYQLIENTRNVSLSDINKLWLPMVTVYAQASAQNNVPEFPSTLTDIMAQMGNSMRGLGNLQYKLGVDINQRIWDGGISKAKRETERNLSNENEASLDVQIYSIHERVISLFFGILLTEEQIKQQENAISLLKSNQMKMEVLFKEGTAMKSDVDNIKAQVLTASQKLSEVRNTLESYRHSLELFIAERIDGKKLEKPSDQIPVELNSNRPELRLYERMLQTNQSKMAEIKASVMPQLGLFAQAFYGYPGFNNFESMMNHKLSFNIMAGVRASWSLNPLYAKKNSLHKLTIANKAIDAERETFLFNTALKSDAQMSEIENMRKVMQSDGEIITLRVDVRKAAEAQLDNGVVDSFFLITKITDETQARLNAVFHEIELLHIIYQLKNTLNQ